MPGRRTFLKTLAAAGAVGLSSDDRQAMAADKQARKGRTAAGDRMTHVYKGAPPDHCVCDQALRVLPDGTWAIVFMTGGDHEPRKANYVAMCRSKDRGRTWSKKETVLRYKDRGCLISEVHVHDGAIHIFAVTHGGYFEDWRNFVLTSRDNGKTWDKPVPFEPLPRRVFVRNLYRASWGEWILPYQSYDTVPDPAVSPLKDGSHRKAINGVLISKDRGRTWIKSAQIGPIAGWAENNVVELGNGHLAMLIRADGKGYLLRSDSTDRGRTWSKPRRTDIINPGSKFRLHRLSTGRIVLIQNANGRPGVRNPLAMWCSDDDMKTWPHQRVLVDFPGQLQYPDGFVDEKGGYVHFAFDYNRHDLIYVGARLP
jgi:predicted neuraminidase